MDGTVRLLRIDLRGASPAARDAFAMSQDELATLSIRAAAAGKHVEAVVLDDEESFEIYTTESSRHAVYRTVLGSIVGRMPGAERQFVRTTEIIGVAAAWHLMQRLCGANGRSGVRMLGALDRAVTRARATGTLGSELFALFGRAADAGWRIQSETMLGDSQISRAEREIDRFEAERIIEEELVMWQAARASEGSVQSIPVSRLDSSYYTASEPGSDIRLKVPSLGELGLLLELGRRGVA
jgi:glutamyl-tRNA reductase